ncbi:SGNH/GDSL hydrolase family protein [Bacillus piscicola]|uniref:SGNH/GDSL hydrolase family protein n=1 Tax=Bacillus piscicola TaxID=1632684 RepID=UPI001F08F127|nr:SGNH/GDSL hydrolase family protein [Bacillus piscicola]
MAKTTRRFTFFLAGALVVVLVVVLALGRGNPGSAVENTPLEKEDITLDHHSYFHNKAKVAFVGSSVTKGIGASSEEKKWTARFSDVLRKEFPGIDTKNFGANGFTTKNIYEEGIVNQVVDYHPDLILFETAALNDFRKIQLPETKKYISKTMETFDRDLPQAHVMIQPSNQRRNGTTITKHGLTYNEYVQETAAFIKKNDWEYLDFWPYFEKTYEENEITVRDTVQEDGVHPNDLGNRLWAEALVSYFDKN